MISICSYLEGFASRFAAVALVFVFPFGMMGCGGEKSSEPAGGIYTSGIGIELREIDATGISIEIEGETERM